MKRLRRRESVFWFSGEMEKVLSANDHKIGWSDCSDIYLYESIQHEMLELFEVLKPLEDDWRKKVKSKEIIKECCDIANFAMMIADNNRERKK